MTDYRTVAFRTYPHRCDRCGNGGSGPNLRLDVHHRDLGRSNHAPENLQILCRSCHRRLHGRLQGGGLVSVTLILTSAQIARLRRIAEGRRSDFKRVSLSDVAREVVGLGLEAVA